MHETSIGIQSNLASSIALQDSIFRTSASSRLRSRQFGFISLSSGPLVFAASATQDDEKHPVLHTCPTVRVWPGALDMSHHTCLSLGTGTSTSLGKSIPSNYRSSDWLPNFMPPLSSPKYFQNSILLRPHDSYYSHTAFPASHISICSTAQSPRNATNATCVSLVITTAASILQRHQKPFHAVTKETKRSTSSISSLGISRVNASK